MATQKLPEFKDDICGEVRKLGSIPMSRDRYRAMLQRTKAIRPVDPALWQEFEHDPGPVKVKDQDGFGACDGHALATSNEWSRRMARMSHVDLSAWYGYAIMCDGIDQGAAIDDALKVVQANGVAPESMVPYGTINPRLLTAAAHLEAKNYRAEAGESLLNFDDMMSATQRFLFGNFSIRVGANFNNLSADGVPGYAPGYGNHAVTFGLGARRLKNGEWALKCQNSWTAKWGQGGYFWIIRKFIDNQAYFQAYTLYAVQDSPSDPGIPKRVA